MNWRLIKSYARHLLGVALMALAGVQWFDAEFSWKVAASTVGVAVVPVIAKWFDSSEPDYGRGAIPQ